MCQCFSLFCMLLPGMTTTSLKSTFFFVGCRATPRSLTLNCLWLALVSLRSLASLCVSRSDSRRFSTSLLTLLLLLQSLLTQTPNRMETLLALFPELFLPVSVTWSRGPPLMLPTETEAGACSNRSDVL